jgi:hypothetical protein
MNIGLLLKCEMRQHSIEIDGLLDHQMGNALRDLKVAGKQNEFATKDSHDGIPRISKARTIS